MSPRIVLNNKILNGAPLSYCYSFGEATAGTHIHTAIDTANSNVIGTRSLLLNQLSLPSVLVSQAVSLHSAIGR